MRGLLSASFDLIYADPPFFTGRVRQSRTITQWRYDDRWSEDLRTYLGFLLPRLAEMHRLLSDRGSLYVHLDWRVVHHVRIALDELFGADNFLNEIVWAYRTGGGSARWFARKHDTLLLYARTRGKHIFHRLRDGQFRTDGLKRDEDGRPFKSTRRGRLYFHPCGPAVTDVWEIPFLSTVSKERTGYPTQKPEVLMERIVAASSEPGSLVGDFFCGSGAFPAAAARLGRRVMACDSNPHAVELTSRRVADVASKGATSKPLRSLQKKTPGGP